MRLGQLARKLAIRPVEIVDFLSRQSIQVDGGNNTRLEDEYVTLILQKYAPGELIENIEKAIIEEEITEIPTIESVNKASSFDIAIPEKIPSILEEEKIEVIKAPKIELSGLKVLGKIELPDLKKKELLVNEEESETKDPVVANQTESRRVIRKSIPQRSNPPNRVKNPVTEKREREAKETEQKRKESIEADKEKRTLHYLKKVNTGQPVKTVKIREEKIEVQKVAKATEPSSLWVKLRRWLTT